MATNTYTALKSTTIGSTSSSATFDLTGISGYTDLICVINDMGADGSYKINFNGDTTSGLYSSTFLYGESSSGYSGRASGQNAVPTVGRRPGNTIIQFQNYANSTTYKNFIARGNASNHMVIDTVGLWRSTAAITSITITPEGGGTFAAGVTLNLYGITAGAAVPTTAKATGGTITYGVEYTYHTFTSSGTFTPSQALSCDYLVVAGGGGGGSGVASANNGGGGGAGGYRTALAQSFASGTGYTITVGAGGAANGNGSNSSMASFAATGGGAGGLNSSVGNGGSGGGSSNTSAAVGTGNAGGYTPVEGYNGSTYGSYWAGGGGGASATGTVNGGGGDGILTTIGPVPTYYAGGGGGGFNSYADRKGLPGLGNTGYGADYAGQWYGTAQPGTVNAGGGGGGGASQGASIPGAAGGSGIVIIRYAN